MRRLYHEDIGPDGQVLGRRQRKANYPAAGGSLYKRVEEEVARAEGRAGPVLHSGGGAGAAAEAPQRLPDGRPVLRLHVLAPKSVSVLWASLLAASAEAEAEGREADAKRLAERAAQVRGAVKRANDRMIAVAERELAYVRTGHHSKTTGEWRDAEGFIVASFEQHDSRDGAPQLHVHNAIANRAQRADGADDLWRALHGHPLFRNKLRMGTLGDRFLRPGAGADRLPERAPRGRDGARGRRDQRRGRGRVLHPEQGTAGPVRGSLRRSTSASTATLRASGPGGRSGSGPPWRRGTQRITTRRRPAQQVAAWARKAERSGIGSAVRASLASARSTRRSTSRAGLPSEAERARIIRKAVAAVAGGQRHVGPVAADFRARPGPARRCPPTSTRRSTSTAWSTRPCPAGPRA